MQATQMKKQRVTFRNILFATDFSPAAKAAMPFAAGLAKSFGANLYAVHVKEPVNYAVPPEMWVGLEREMEMEEEALREEMHKQFPEITPRILEGAGEVWNTLAEVIAEREIDLVVVGTRGRTGLEKVLLGSKAEEILRRANCPVLTIGPEVDARKGLIGKMVSILCATHFGIASLKAARVAVSLAEEYQSKLTMMTVLGPKDENKLGVAEDFGETSENQLREMVPEEAALWCAPRFVVERGAAAEKILELAAREKADLIVLGAHATEGIPGAKARMPMATVHQIVTNAKCPVLTIRG
jgi:nucleotide-binding universal stress UspA family protein